MESVAKVFKEEKEHLTTLKKKGKKSSDGQRRLNDTERWVRRRGGDRGRVRGLLLYRQPFK